MSDENRVPMQDTIAAYYAEGGDGQVGAPRIMRTSAAAVMVRVRLLLQRRYVLSDKQVSNATALSAKKHLDSAGWVKPGVFKVKIGTNWVIFLPGMQLTIRFGDSAADDIGRAVNDSNMQGALKALGYDVQPLEYLTELVGVSGTE